VINLTPHIGVTLISHLKCH